MHNAPPPRVVRRRRGVCPAAPWIYHCARHHCTLHVINIIKISCSVVCALKWCPKLNPNGHAPNLGKSHCYCSIYSNTGLSIEVCRAPPSCTCVLVSHCCKWRVSTSKYLLYLFVCEANTVNAKLCVNSERYIFYVFLSINAQYKDVNTKTIDIL